MRPYSIALLMIYALVGCKPKASGSDVKTLARAEVGTDGSVSATIITSEKTGGKENIIYRHCKSFQMPSNMSARDMEDYANINAIIDTTCARSGIEKEISTPSDVFTARLTSLLGELRLKEEKIAPVLAQLTSHIRQKDIFTDATEYDLAAATMTGSAVPTYRSACSAPSYGDLGWQCSGDQKNVRPAECRTLRDTFLTALQNCQDSSCQLTCTKKSFDKISALKKLPTSGVQCGCQGADLFYGGSKNFASQAAAAVMLTECRQAKAHLICMPRYDDAVLAEDASIETMSRIGSAARALSYLNSTSRPAKSPAGFSLAGPSWFSFLNPFTSSADINQAYAQQDAQQAQQNQLAAQQALASQLNTSLSQAYQNASTASEGAAVKNDYLANYGLYSVTPAYKPPQLAINPDGSVAMPPRLVQYQTGVDAEGGVKYTPQNYSSDPSLDAAAQAIKQYEEQYGQGSASSVLTQVAQDPKFQEQKPTLPVGQEPISDGFDGLEQ